jgi:aspartate/tyrosine/aromatic aminotransferase
MYIYIYIYIYIVTQYYCVQYSKNFGLYGERIGGLNIVTKDAAAAGRIRSQLNGYVFLFLSLLP